jgi:prefoldin subunit 5
MEESSESEVIAQEVSTIAARVSALDARLREVETVIDRLEAAAATTARALDEVSSHWDAVYRAMRRAECVQPWVRTRRRPRYSLARAFLRR